MTPRVIPTTVSTSRISGCCQAFCGLIAATTITTAVVIPVVTMSSRRPNAAMTSVPMPSSAAKPNAVNGKIKRYGRQSAKLTQVAISLAIPADRARARVSLNTKTTATTAHIPPRKPEAWSTNRESI